MLDVDLLGTAALGIKHAFRAMRPAAAGLGRAAR